MFVASAVGLFAAMIVRCLFCVIVNLLLLVVLFREVFGLLCVMRCLRLLGIVSCLLECWFCLLRSWLGVWPVAVLCVIVMACWSVDLWFGIVAGWWCVFF